MEDMLILIFVHAGKTVHRGPGDKWMIRGPAEYIPKIEIGKMERRSVQTVDVVWIPFTNYLQLCPSDPLP